MDLVYVQDGVLDSTFCKDVIRKFEFDQGARPGITFAGYHPNVKFSKDLYISRIQDWDDICTKLDDILKQYIQKYEEFVNSTFPEPQTFSDVWHTGYQIQESGHYVWHNDSAIEHGKERILTFIFYLNTIEEGGETDFSYKSVNPVEGRLVMFPATWNYIHCGKPATRKFILTGWLWRNVITKKQMD